MKVKALPLLPTTCIFLISNFHRVPNVIFFLLGDSPASVSSILIILREADYFGNLYSRRIFYVYAIRH